MIASTMPRRNLGNAVNHTVVWQCHSRRLTRSACGGTATGESAMRASASHNRFLRLDSSQYCPSLPISEISGNPGPSAARTANGSQPLREVHFLSAGRSASGFADLQSRVHSDCRERRALLPIPSPTHDSQDDGGIRETRSPRSTLCRFGSLSTAGSARIAMARLGTGPSHRSPAVLE